MNRQILRHYINEYKLNFDRVNQEEIYKWKAVKCYQDNWNIEAENFYEMLMVSLSRTKNLLDSGQYFPLRMLVQYAEHRPNEVRQLFRNLYNEEEDLFERIQNFQTNINVINDELFKNKKSYQDPRAIIVYLVLRYPERYFFYKFEMFKQFSKKLELIYKPVKGHLENIGHFNSQCELIRFELSLDQELLKLHKNRITSDCYYDENLNILTQDFIYAVARHLDQAILVDTSEPTEIRETNVLSTDLRISADQISFRGRTVNFIQNGIENKRLGDLGELWVMKYEIEKLQNAKLYNLIDKIKHTSKDEGDGTGFDIQSFDIYGNKIFIEAKTTKGKQNSTFFVTRNELERSKIEKENYYLYRLYNYSEQTDTADLLIIQGDLTNICEFPTTYKINLHNG
ncbi:MULTISPECIES: DUF3883 domain-containing protein [Chryseobacterium]|uniref:DUF3883 domain-containing protein n=1 Tax=Chryseobacterium manosquense TaxID=2754694 RepID=A0A7H1DXB6_9FLAO|nr:MULTISPECIES: DUF3883 domain-containing protein [Chryseobacterium]QNS41624.1 DUF3883 domain-containing protein [Chryseobacterium manosquense]VFA40744.1 Uncharacterised protein [Chryseobacterium indologenes]